MMTQKNVNLLVIIILAMIFITIGGIFYDVHSHLQLYEREPILWPLAIGFSTAGGALILGLMLRHFVPVDVMNEMRNIRAYR
jgi:amino acid transporter